MAGFYQPGPLDVVAAPATVAYGSGMTNILHIAIGVLALAGAARVVIPLEPVPITLQTLVLVVAAALGGQRRGTWIAAAYACAAAAGWPVLAEGRGGVDALMGPSAGYLAGFIVAAWWIGGACGRGTSWLRMTLVMIAAHLVIVCTGGAWVADMFGVSVVLEGALRLMPGALIKSAVGAAIVVGVRRRIERGAS